MAKWAKRWYWREQREAERESGVQHSLVSWPSMWSVFKFDDSVGVDSAMSEDATIWTAHFISNLAGLTTRLTPGPAIIIRPGACNCGASGSEYPNQHTRACPQFKSNFCHCPPATGPNQPHRDDCCRYRRDGLRTDSYFGISQRTIDFGLPYGTSKTHEAELSAIQMQAYAAALSWMEKHDVQPIKCTCAARVGVIGHSRYCPLGDGTASEGTPDLVLLDDLVPLDPQ